MSEEIILDKVVQLIAIKRALDNKIEREKNGDAPLKAMSIEVELVCLRDDIRQKLESK